MIQRQGGTTFWEGSDVVGKPQICADHLPKIQFASAVMERAPIRQLGPRLQPWCAHQAFQGLSERNRLRRPELKWVFKRCFSLELRSRLSIM